MDDAIKVMEWIKNEFDGLNLKSLSKDQVRDASYQRAAALDIVMRLIDNHVKTPDEVVDDYILEMQWIKHQNPHNETLQIILANSIIVAERILTII